VSFLSNLFGGSNGHIDPAKHMNHDAERQQRLLNYRRTWEAYLAELPDPLVNDNKANDNVKVNPARAIINTGVFFLFGGELKFQLSPTAQIELGQKTEAKGSATAISSSTPPWLKQLNKAWKANRKQSWLFNLGLSGAIHGTPFVKFLPESAGLNNEFPRLQLLDPANVDVEWDPNDHNKILKYCIEFVTEDPNTGEPELQVEEITANMDENEIIRSWTVQKYQQTMQFEVNVGYVPAVGERIPVGPPIEWPYAWAPIEHCQNVELPHMFWGLPDLDASSVEVIESLQRSMSSLNKIVRVHASPRMFAKNVMPDQVDDIDVSPDNIITLPNMEADLGVLQTLQNIGPSIQYAQEQRKMLLEMVQVPPISLGDFESASTAISGVTLSILYAPLLQKTELKRISYGDMLERINHKMLILMGQDVEDIDSLVLVWPEAMPGSAYLERQTLEQDLMMGVSKHTIHTKLGYDPEAERKYSLEEQEQSLELQKKYAPEPAFGSNGTPGGNNNPTGKGNKSGSLGGTKAAGTPKTPSSGTTKPV